MPKVTTQISSPRQLRQRVEKPNTDTKQNINSKTEKKDKSVKSEKPHKMPRHVEGFPLPNLLNEEIGDVFVVGSGDCDQLGLGEDVREKEKFGKLAYFDDKDIVKVVAGGMHTVAISKQGKLYSWGCNDEKALGRAGEQDVPLPITALEHETIVQVCCGDNCTAALTADGRVYNWGSFRSSTGSFGIKGGIMEKDGIRVTNPLLVKDLNHIKFIAAGSNHLVAIGHDGKIYTWGIGEQGQLGRKILQRFEYNASLTPRVINFKPKGKSSKFIKAYAGSFHTFFVHESEEVYACGLDNYGQLGLAKTSYEVNHTPEKVEGDFNGVNFISAGEHHSLLLDNEGKIFSFGRGDSGQLGHDDEKDKNFPELLNNIPLASQITCGSNFSLAITADQSAGDNLYGWGYGEMGQLANGGQDETTPANIKVGGRVVIGITAGGQHTVAF
ncbi:Regulator of chromosome condensation [Clydaea vesicula]|uniref:Regulator of chromosome condensation n=1 Tax=Clydaea vesicula TaxID=447962 RepID=A0AAD5TW36_9FUNG|nr:Regulator of chromosome condensation [Clydaea vesicula]